MNKKKSSKYLPTQELTVIKKNPKYVPQHINSCGSGSVVLENPIM